MNFDLISITLKQFQIVSLNKFSIIVVIVLYGILSYFHVTNSYDVFKTT